MGLVVTPKEYIIGPARVYHRDVGVNTPWTGMGVSLDDSVFRLVAQWFRPDNLTGVMGPIMGLDVLQRINASMEFTIPNLSGANMDLALPGSRVTAETHATVGGGLSTTLSAAAAVGATTVSLVAVTGLAVGDFISIAGADGAEYRQVTAIDTLDVSFRDPLLKAHASGQAVVETDGDYRTKIEAPIIQRMPDSAYKEWAFVSSNGNGYHELRLPRGMSEMDTTEVQVAGNSLTGLRFMISGRLDPDDLDVSPYQLFQPAN